MQPHVDAAAGFSPGAVVALARLARRCLHCELLANAGLERPPMAEVRL